MKPGCWLALCLCLAGCSSIGAISGAVVGVATGAGTSNPLVGYAVGVGTQAAVDELVRYVSRRRQRGEQDEIAAVVGRLGVGETAAWRIDHDIPIGNAHGEVTVAAAIDNALAPCKQAVFTVAGDKPGEPPAGMFVTTACDRGGQWKWAQAEPATSRWGFLQ